MLQENEFERVGDDITRSVDVRVVAATNRDLEALVLAGEFREDLFYRISVFPIEVPPLRERRDDIVQLAQHFLGLTCSDCGRSPFKLTRSQAGALREYNWPGNIRELKNVIERAVILSPGDHLRLDLSLPQSSAPDLTDAQQPDSQQVLTEDEIKALQRKNIEAALRTADWRVSGKNGAAELLGIKPTTLADRIKAFGLRRPER